jgi:hypothetical protein
VLHSGEFCYYDVKLARVWNESGIRLNEDKRATENIVSEYVEPEPTYEPWDFESMPVAVKVRGKYSKKEHIAISLKSSVWLIDGGTFSYNILFMECEQLDGTPCGRIKS